MAEKVVKTKKDKIQEDLGFRISIPVDAIELLEKDKEFFRINKINDLYNRIVGNYYESYKEKYNDTKKEIINTLKIHKLIKKEDKEIEKTISDIIDNIRLNSYEDYHDNTRTERIKVKIQKKYMKLYKDILKENYLLSEKSRSMYFRTMFTSYGSFPQYIREKIIFKDKIDLIEEAINNRKSIRLKLKDDDKEHFIYPYCITESDTEQQLYVLGIEKFEKKKDITDRFTPCTYKLLSIEERGGIKVSDTIEYPGIGKDSKGVFFTNIPDLSTGDEAYRKLVHGIPDFLARKNASFDTRRLDNYVLKYPDSFDDEIRKAWGKHLPSIIYKLVIMRDYSPNFAYRTNEDIFVKVTLTKEGEEKLNRIYTWKPHEISKEGNTHTYLCPSYQAFTYFLKFGTDVVDIEPKELKDKLDMFHGIKREGK